MSIGHGLTSPRNLSHRRPVVIEDDNDVQATLKKKQGNMQEGERTQADEANRDHKPELLDSVEICNARREKDVTELQSPKSRKKLLSTEGKRRVSTGRESPDELQGDITVQRAPPLLNEVYVREASVSSSADRSKTDTNRRSSPSDIRPTEFTSASSKKQGKTKRNEKTDKGSHKKLFEIDLFHFGPIERVSCEGQTFELVVDKARDRLCLAETAGKDSDQGVDIPLQKITTVLEGEGPSRKVRLRLSKVEGSDEVVDIQLGSEKEKDGLCKILKRRDIKFLPKEGYAIHASCLHLKLIDFPENGWTMHSIRTKRTLLHRRVATSAPTPRTLKNQSKDRPPKRRNDPSFPSPFKLTRPIATAYRGL